MATNKPQKHNLKKQKKPKNPDAKITFLEHLYELRARVFWVVLALMIASAVGFQYKDWLVSFVMAPLHGEKLVYLTPGGGFSFIFTLCIYFGALFTIPVAVYHLYRFLEPLLRSTSRKLVALFIVLSAMLAMAGAAFGYFVTIPAAINFLSTFAGDTIVPDLTADSYLSFVVTYIFGLAALFQVPLLLFIIDYVRPLPPKFLSSTQTYVIIGASVIAAIITPTPDAFNMAIVAVPIVAVYEIGAFAVHLRHRVLRRSAKKAKNTVVAPVMQQKQPTRESSGSLAAIIEALETVEDQVEPVVEQQQSAVQPSLRPRVIDGFARSSQQARLNPRVPQRSTRIVPPARTTQSFRGPMQSSARHRSIDGFRLMPSDGS